MFKVKCAICMSPYGVYSTFNFEHQTSHDPDFKLSLKITLYSTCTVYTNKPGNKIILIIHVALV